MIKKVAQKKILFISTTIILITLFWGTIFIYKPFVSKKDALKTKIQDQTKRNLYLGQIKILKEHVDSYERRLPEGKSVSVLLETVSRLASENALELISIEPETQEDQGAFVKVPIKLVANSTYHQLGTFLSQLESSKKFIKVDNIQVKRIDEKIVSQGTALKIKADIRISSIILKD